MTRSQLFEDVIAPRRSCRPRFMWCASWKMIIVQYAVRADLGQDRWRIDQHRAVSSCDRTKDRPEIGLAANRKAILVSCDDEFLAASFHSPAPASSLPSR